MCSPRRLIRVGRLRSIYLVLTIELEHGTWRDSTCTRHGLVTPLDSPGQVVAAVFDLR